MSSDRRGFFKTVAGAAASLATVEAVLDATGATPPAAAAVTATRSFVASRFALELDGAAAGFVHSFEGGEAAAEVVEESSEGFTCARRKHLGNVKYEDIVLVCGTGMSGDFYKWLEGFTTCDFAARNGAIVAADFNFKEASRRNFMDALITELGFPALDAASKEAATFSVKLSPESSQRQKGSGKTVTGCGGTGKLQKKWLASNFRLTIDGLDCKKVNAIEALTIKQQVVENAIGEGRQLGKREVPNLVITLAEASAQSFFDWEENFVIRGFNGQEEEKSGRLEYLTPNLADVLFTLEFQNLGIFRLAEVAESADMVRRVRAEMYCEQIILRVGKGVAGC